MLCLIVLVAGCNTVTGGPGAAQSPTSGPSGSTGPSSPTGPGGATDVAGCKKACDQQKFFMCNDALQQAQCYTACEQVTEKQIELFEACVKNSVCDASCSTNLAGAQPNPSSPPTSGSDCGRAVQCLQML
jgi:hypothetical protein